MTNELATEARPLRASQLPKLMECAASVLLELLGCDDSGSGVAADTGSIMHAGAAAWHNGKDGLAAMEAAREKFPQGNHDKAVKHWEAYVADDENKNAQVVKVEEKIRCRLPDPQGGPDIVIHGTLDQLLLIDGRHSVADIKTGATYYGQMALRHYAMQQAAYTVGACQTFGLPVHPGKLICTDGYFRRNGKVHWEYKYQYEDCLTLLQSVVGIVSNARRGMMMVNPSDSACHWCKFKDPENCLPLLRRTA